jgi:hypothetical protein
VTFSPGEDIDRVRFQLNDINIGISVDVLSYSFFDVCPPVIAVIGDDATGAGVAYSRTPTLADGHDTISWSLVASPSGATINSSTGEVSLAFPFNSYWPLHQHTDAI